MREGLFQSKEFYTFLQGSGVLEPFRYVVSREGREVGVIQGFIQKDGGRIKQFFSRRAIINGGPWLSEDIANTELEQLLRNCIDDLKRKVIYIETRNFSDYSSFHSSFEKVGFVYEPHYDFVIDTSCRETVNSHMGKSRDRDANSSLKNGATVTENPTETEVIAYYSLLAELYKTKIKKPLFPQQFFLQLWAASLSKFLLVKYNEEVIGGTVSVYDDETIYEWFVCGKDSSYPKVFPSTLATWSAIRYAANNGFKRFDMMGAGAPGDGGYGVREFKAKFGGELVEYGRFVYVCSKPLYDIGKAAISIMKKL